MILAGDIGGTHIRLARFEPPAAGGRPEWTREGALATAEVADPAEAVAAFARELGERPVAVGLGVAGPHEGDVVWGTNLPWDVRASAVAARLGEPRVPVVLLNDLVAAAHGLGDLAADDRHTLQEGEPDPDANRALVSPGTGLGECLIAGQGPDTVVIGTEGGHADFAPTTDEQLELWRFLAARFGRVSWERVVSGPGLANVAAWLCGTGRFEGDPGRDLLGDPRHPSPDAPGRLAAAALAGTSDLGTESLRVWSEALAAEAGNAALRANARGGVYLGGGIPAKVLPRLRDPDFLARFRAKPPHEAMLARVPVIVVLDSRLGLRGAARRAADRAGSGSG